MASRLVVNVSEMAVKSRLPEEGLVAHSDRGSQYASEHYQRLLCKHGIERSMSRVVPWWDVVHRDVKKKLVHDEDDQTRDKAKASVFKYIEMFDNRQRRHSALG